MQTGLLHRRTRNQNTCISNRTARIIFVKAWRAIPSIYGSLVQRLEHRAHNAAMWVRFLQEPPLNLQERSGQLECGKVCSDLF